MTRISGTAQTSTRLAVPTWNGRVSPVFDTASRLILVDVERGAERARQVVEIDANASPVRRVRRCEELRVTVLICGAISRPLAELLTTVGVMLFPWVAGPVDDVLQAYFAERIGDPCWRMPGCSSCPAQEPDASALCGRNSEERRSTRSASRRANPLGVQ